MNPALTIEQLKHEKETLQMRYDFLNTVSNKFNKDFYKMKSIVKEQSKIEQRLSVVVRQIEQYARPQLNAV